MLFSTFIPNTMIQAETFSPNKKERLLTFPEQWKFLINREMILLTSNQQLKDLQDPDKKINMSLTGQKDYRSLREICESAAHQGNDTIILAFDNFFRAFRKNSKEERAFLPDSDEYIQIIKKISDFMAKYDLGLELSLLSPLELGPAFFQNCGEPGRWVHYKVGLRDPKTGQFNVMMWQQLSWSNNKGKFPIKRKGVRVFTFKEKEIANGRYSVVHPKDIKEITSGINIEEWPGTESPAEKSFRAKRIRVYHQGNKAFQGYDRVLVLLIYQSPEMDYFSPKAPGYLRNLIKKYWKAGIRLNALYSDEMHIQQDWNYFNHHDNGQFALRYLTKNMATRYAQLYGAEYEDMDKYMLYFCYGPKIFLNTSRANRNTQYIMGELPEDIHKTILFRDRYYKLLNHHLVDLFLQAKTYAEKLYGKELLTRAHASWAQSPTIDQWEVGNLHHPGYQYEYTPNFIWSNTVHQAASGCYDYFKWGEFLNGSGNDFAEAGWADRNYYGLALACSIGIINRYPNAYSFHSCMPEQVAERRRAIADAFGTDASPTIKSITDNVHRDVEVLMLYPMSLVAAEERFGSWMVQYGYANYITAEKLLEIGKVTSNGKIELADRSFSTLVALFEIIPPPGIIEMMNTLTQNGGKAIWSGPPPLISADGKACLRKWEKLFNVHYSPSIYQGEIAAGKVVEFQNSLQTIPDQIILTDFIIDRIYPVTPKPGSEIVATINNKPVGVKQKNDKGFLYYLGFRPRDDQSMSLGREQRTWFEVLNAIGSYPSTGKFKGTNDNTEYISRTTDYCATHFPNGTTILAKHYRKHQENWPGSFARDDLQDKKILRKNPLPSDKIKVTGIKVNGHEISYDGRLILAFNTDAEDNLIAFEGHDCNQITIDGKFYKLSDKKQNLIAWAPVSSERRITDKAFFQIFFEASGDIFIPFKKIYKNMKLFKEGNSPGSKGEEIPFELQKGILKLFADKTNANCWLYMVGEN